jgi:dTMP kinase
MGHQSPYIVIEGLDGAGGTTQCRLLKSWLEQHGQTVVLTNEPTDLPVGSFIRQVLQDPNSTIGDSVLPYLFAADRQHHLDTRVIPSLKNGSIVISDRYYHSSLAYQSLSLDFDLVAKINSPFPEPSVTFFLQLEPEISFERVQLRGLPMERFETLDKLRTISQSYDKVIQYCKSKGENIICIDATQTINEIHESICQYIQPMLNQ